jgi:hypothetical protein
MTAHTASDAPSVFDSLTPSAEVAAPVPGMYLTVEPHICSMDLTLTMMANYSAITACIFTVSVRSRAPRLAFDDALTSATRSRCIAVSIGYRSLHSSLHAIRSACSFTIGV